MPAVVSDASVLISLGATGHSLNQLIHHQNFRLSLPLYEQLLQQVGEQA
ncbi:MAG: hypothetical protein HZA90_06950 [Verrucomicrobia bacterium]|nr:hypothetical protein [Verrucomicrobiota bacterium]